MKSIFSIDVEDWFHILDIQRAPSIDDWGNMPSRIESNFLKLLDILAAKDARATCFFLGWIGEKFPHLIKETHQGGHEIASHGYGHILAYKMTRQEFFEDAAKTKKLLEDITGYEVSGFRASGFSVTNETPWFWEELARAGYQYSSSVFPAVRGHGGLKTKSLEPHVIDTEAGRVMEFPVSVGKLFGRKMSFFGGGYLRFFPYRIIRRKAFEVLKDNRPLIWYLHPREIDPDQPRLPMNPLRRFKSYCNLKSTELKLNKILDDFECMSFSEYIAANRMGIDRNA